ncbi:MAG: peptidoglycan DD-metalloendopeptidase family protein, partial [Gammaproteobacteria bacterium]|nr:peptidoglycan DD-metalloendopeptidase family protein [Gammaproteobacteria bacterium]
RELARKRELERQRKQQATARQKIQQKQNTTIAKANPPALKGGNFPQMKGQLRLPVSAPISARFGQTNQESGTKWDGVWFSAPENTVVQAIYRGQVAYADWFRGFGLLLIIDHGDGYMSLYSHNKELNKSLGDTVETGDAIARVGSTGGLPKPGLYFEVRENGQPRNPLIWCKA